MVYGSKEDWDGDFRRRMGIGGDITLILGLMDRADRARCGGRNRSKLGTK